MSRAVGKSVSHESAVGHVTGQAKYVDDIWPRMAKVAHAWPVVSPYAHARVLKLDWKRAMTCPGALGCYCAADVPGENEIGPARRDEPLFPEEVSFLGQPVAWVAAETEQQAIAAAALVEVEYEELPAIIGIEEARRAGSFLAAPERIRRGQPEEAIAHAEHQLKGELFVGGQEHFYLETQAALAWVDEGGSVFVQSSTQHPSETQEIVARVLGRPRSEVVVQCVRMGGAFGGKEVQASAWAAVAALISSKLDRPARVRLTRHQDMTITGKRHPFLGCYQVGFSAAGKLEALKIELFSDGGWSLDLSSPVLGRAMFHLDNCYRLNHVDVTGRVCRTNTVSNTAFRGFGGPQGMIMIEEIMAHISRVCGVPADEVRERNFYREGDTAHYGQEITDAGRIQYIWDRLKETSRFVRRRRDVDEFNAASPYLKRGLAITPVKFGISFTTAMFNQAGALVLIFKDGSVQLNHGGTEMGQGLHTKMQQVAADALGIPMSLVRPMPTRTDKVPNTSATAASSGSDLNGAAIKNACDTLRERLSEVAARYFQKHPADLCFENGEVYSSDAVTQRLTFSQLVNMAYTQRVALFASGYYRTPHIHYDAKAGRGKPFHYYAFGAAVSEVSVDCFTGQYQIIAVDILHDVGKSLSPLVDKGQIEGGFIQGVGWLTTEQLVWKRSGQLVTAGASTYKLPTLGECPLRFVVDLLPRVAQPDVIHGSKAVGEPPFMLAFSVREALRDAIGANAASKRSIVELACPATPEEVFWALERVASAPPSMGVAAAT